MVKTRSLETVAAPSGSVGTLVSHSTLPVARLSASTSPVWATAGLVAVDEVRVVAVIGRSMVATYTLPSATAMFDSTPPRDPGSNVYGYLIFSLCASASRESLSCPLCSPTGVFHSSAPDRALSA